MVEQTVGGANFLDLPSLDSGENSNLTSECMTDILCQGISVDYKNNPAPKNIPDEVPQPEDA